MDTLLILLVGAVMLWGLYSAISTLYPLKPFRRRGQAFTSLVASILTFLAYGYLASKTDSPAKEPVTATQGENAALNTPALTSTALPQACGESGVALNDVLGVNGEAWVRVAPAETAARLKNEKASKMLGADHFHQVDGSTTVRRLCVQPEWTQIQMVTPEWMTHVKGWVPNAALRQIERTAAGVRIYVEDDFYWDKTTSQFKPQIVAVVNKIARENANCATPDTGAVALSPSRSKPGDPVFFLTCSSGADAFNVWFRPGDATGDTSFQARAPMAHGPAVDACEQAAKAAAMHPSTVEFSRVWDLAYLPHASGRAQVISSFSAKNAFDLALEYRIRCLFDGNTLIDTQIAEKG